MKLKALLAACMMSLHLGAHAGLTSNIHEIANPQIIDFENFDGLITDRTEPVAPGIDFTGTPGSVLGAFIADLGSNGLWGAGNHFAATDNVGTFHFTFVNGQASAAGALLNSYNGEPISITVFGANHQMLESHSVDIDTPEESLNAGVFFGIARPAADIRSILFAGRGLVADNLTFATPVPEPETYMMLLAGLGMIGVIARRRAFFNPEQKAGIAEHPFDGAKGIFNDTAPHASSISDYSFPAGASLPGVFIKAATTTRRRDFVHSAFSTQSPQAFVV